MKRKRSVVLLVALFAAVLTVADDLNSLRAEGDQFWAERDSQPSLLKAIDAYSRALAILPDDKALLARLSIAYYWKGINIKEERKEERKVAFTSRQMYAQKLCELDPNSIESNFWYAVNLARYGGEVGVMKSAFMLPDIKKWMKKVMNQEKFYYHGGPQRLLARIDYSTPRLFRGSFENAVNMLKEAIQVSPNFPLSRVYLADIYMEMKKPKLARKELDFVLKMSETALPGFEPEIRRDKRTAKELMKKYFDK